MTWSRMYVKSNIQKKKDLFIATISWSYYGFLHYDDLEIFDSMEDAKHWILEQRTNGSLTFSNL
jgi:hypothetical protein